MTCKREDQVADGGQISKSKGLSRWEAGGLFKCYFEIFSSERGNPLQYSCLENPMNSGTRQTTVHGDHTESDMTEVTEHAHTHRRRKMRQRSVARL